MGQGRCIAFCMLFTSLFTVALYFWGGVLLLSVVFIFPPLRSFSALIIPRPLRPFTSNILEHNFRFCPRWAHAASGLMEMSCDCGEMENRHVVRLEIVRLCENAAFNRCSEHYSAYFSHPRSYLQSKHLGRPCFRVSIAVQQWSLTSLLPVKSLYPECLFMPERD